MSIPRFYCPLDIQENTEIILPDTLANHAMRALRLRNGDEIIIFNGQGGQWLGKIDFSQGISRVYNLVWQDINVETKGEITLIQALPSGDKMDWIIEKAVEMGVSHLIPIQAERSVLRLQGERMHKRLERWQRIIESATEQCGRTKLMTLSPVQSIHDLIFSNRTFVCQPNAGHALQSILTQSTPSAISLLIGPEGGWSDKELQTLINHGAQAIQFGNRVLRTETAGIALVSACLSLLNW